MKNQKSRIIVIGIILFVVSEILTAQTFSLQSIPSEKSQFSIKYRRPNIASSFVDYSTFSGNYELMINVPMGYKYNLILKIPYINVAYEMNSYFGKFSEEETGLGNIFIGSQTKTAIAEDRFSVITFGLFLPSAEDKVSLWGLFSDYLNFQKYIAETYALYFNFAHHKYFKNGIILGLEIGPSLTFAAGNSNNDSELYCNYGVSTGFKASQLVLNLDFTGMAIVTGNAEDRFYHAYSIGMGWQEDWIMPKIFYQTYLNEDLVDIVDGTIGFEIQFWTN